MTKSNFDYWAFSTGSVIGIKVSVSSVIIKKVWMFKLHFCIFASNVYHCNTRANLLKPKMQKRMWMRLNDSKWCFLVPRVGNVAICYWPLTRPNGADTVHHVQWMFCRYAYAIDRLICKDTCWRCLSQWNSTK